MRREALKGGRKKELDDVEEERERERKRCVRVCVCAAGRVVEQVERLTPD